MIPEKGSCIISMAPLAGYTDFIFRGIVREIYLELATTEMISVRGIIYGDEETMRMVREVKSERDTGIQLFGFMAEDFVLAMEKIQSEFLPLLFELNAGCPVKKVVKKGAGAALLKDPGRLREILLAMKEVSKVPVSLKTRLGWSDRREIENILKIAEEVGVDWITVHARTKEQMFGGRAELDYLGSVISGYPLPVVANGDIRRREDFEYLCEKYEFDGVAVGRGVIGNPWIFREMRKGVKPDNVEKVETIKKHLFRNVEYYGEHRGVLKMIPHLVKYVRNLPDARKWRERIVRAREPETIIGIIEEAFMVNYA